MWDYPHWPTSPSKLTQANPASEPCFELRFYEGLCAYIRDKEIQKQSVSPSVHNQQILGILHSRHIVTNALRSSNPRSTWRALAFSSPRLEQEQHIHMEVGTSQRFGDPTCFQLMNLTIESSQKFYHIINKQSWKAYKITLPEELALRIEQLFTDCDQNK